jgi:murein DD-endopeptidase MepM/ murein hydrolase activator NlpD
MPPRKFWGNHKYHLLLITVFCLLIVNSVYIALNNYKDNNQKSTIQDENKPKNSDQINFEKFHSELANIDERLSALEDTLQKHTNCVIEEGLYEIQKGDTYKSIAGKCDIDLELLSWANKVAINSEIKVTQKEIIIPDPPSTEVTYHIVQSTDTITSLQEKYGFVSIDPILWLNDGPLVDNRIILVPSVNGILTSKSFEILSADQVIKNSKKQTGNNTRKLFSVPDAEFKGVFANPLGDPSCEGYQISREFSPYHKTFDFGLKHGCWISSIGDGQIYKVGIDDKYWGNFVIIKHPNEYYSLYAHGNGKFGVREGETVQKGQLIMYMGRTERTLGTQLRFQLSKDAILWQKSINPKGIVPF